MIKLQNKKLLVEINEHGAEVKRVYHLEHELDYLWNSNPAFWAKSSPILFPIVGRLAQDHYLHQGTAYQLSQHGFARDLVFDVITHTETNVWFELKSNPQTLEKYPFEFILRIGYELEEETLKVKWEVLNTSADKMPFSIGAHPAFSTKLQEGDNFSDYYLHFENNEGVKTRLFDNETGRVFDETEEIIDKLKLLPLSKALFEEYATLIIDGETGVTLGSYNNDREVVLKCDGFPYLGIWAPINREGDIADFVCLEPWYGLADGVSEPQELMSKRGIQVLDAQETFKTQYTMTFK